MANDNSYIEALMSWDPYTPLDFAKDVVGEAGSTARTGIEAVPEVSKSVGEEISQAVWGIPLVIGLSGLALGGGLLAAKKYKVI